LTHAALSCDGSYALTLVKTEAKEESWKPSAAVVIPLMSSIFCLRPSNDFCM
jgi:hypothetical protein